MGPCPALSKSGDMDDNDDHNNDEASIGGNSGCAAGFPAVVTAAQAKKEKRLEL